jgi:hypothetical protein
MAHLLSPLLAPNRESKISKFNFEAYAVLEANATQGSFITLDHDFFLVDDDGSASAAGFKITKVMSFSTKSELSLRCKGKGSHISEVVIDRDSGSRKQIVDKRIVPVFLTSTGVIG